LSVSPTNQGVTNAAGTTTFTASNTGPTGSSLSYTTAEIETWLSITGGATGTCPPNATITVSSSQNTGAARVGTITVTATGATGSPTTVTVSQACANLTITSAASRKTHGTIGTFSIASGSVECRKNQVTQVATVFNLTIQRLNNNSTDVSVSSGTVSTISITTTTVTNDTLIVNMTLASVTDKAVFTIKYPGIYACETSNKTTASKCWKVLCGDIDGSGKVLNADVTAVVGKLGQVADATIFRRDWDASGKILNADTTGVVGKLGHSCPGCVCTP